jgi:MinD-like ATPase involved in chromosome partitioning or flagellar assembly
VAGKGGEGKTVVSVNLAAAFAMAGERVLYLDLDTGLGKRNPNWPVETPRCLSDFWTGARSLESLAATVRLKSPRHPEGVRVDVIAGRLEHLPPGSDPEALGEALARSPWQRIVMDMGAGTKRAIFGFAALADRLLMVSGPHPNALRETADIAGCAFLLRRDLPMDVLFNRCPRDSRASCAENLRKAFREKFVAFEEGEVPRHGPLSQFVDEKGGQLRFIEHSLPVLPPGGKRLLPERAADSEGRFFLDLAGEYRKMTPGAAPAWGGLLRRFLSPLFAGKASAGNPETCLEPYRDWFRRNRAREAPRAALSRIRFLAGAKGGVGQTECLARLAVLGAQDCKAQLLYDLNMEETSRHSSLGWYFKLRQPVAQRTLWEKDGHLWPLDRRRRIDLFFYRNRQEVESAASFLDAFLERALETAGAGKWARLWADAESGIEAPVLLLSLLGGNLAVVSDSGDAESEAKLLALVEELSRALDWAEWEGQPFSLALLLTRWEPEKTAVKDAAKRRAAAKRLAGEVRARLGGRLPAWSEKDIFVLVKHPAMAENFAWEQVRFDAEEKRVLSALFPPVKK